MPDTTQPSPSPDLPEQVSSIENSAKPVTKIQVISSNGEEISETAPPLAPGATTDSDELLKQIDSTGDDMIPAPEPDQEVKIEPEDTIPEAEQTDESEVMRDESVVDSDDEEGSNVQIGDPLLEQADQSSFENEESTNETPSLWKRILKNKWFWLALVVFFLVVVLVAPQTRYKVLGLVIHKSVKITVEDSVTNTPVSDASVTLGSQSGKTNSNGSVELKVPIGKATLAISKQYYTSVKEHEIVGLGSTGLLKPIQLVATGRQVPVMVENTISAQPLANAVIQIIGTTAKTNSAGKATIVLPTRASSYQAQISLAGYTAATQNITLTTSLIGTNIIHLTPTGKIFYLSDASGTIDVIKSNLDGTGRQTVLAGTGTENPNKTVLLASKDWRYLVLQSQRSANQSGLYLIDATTNKVTEFDNSSGDFTLVGWYGHDFIYDVTLNTVPASQSGHELLKLYDADTGQLMQLDSNQAMGTSASYAFQSFYNFYLIGDNVVYDTQWNTTSLGASSSIGSTLNDTIRETPTGSGSKKDVESILAASTSYIQTVLANPQTVYYAFTNSSSGVITYYEYDGTSVSSPSNLNQTTFAQTYPTYLFSPGGTKTIWSEILAGNSSQVVGNATAQNPQTIAHLNGYTPYGWYTDNYVLVTNNGNLYVMPVSGITATQKPYLVSAIYQSSQAYPNIESSYGGQ